VRQHLVAFLDGGVSVVVLSAGALADDTLREAAEAAARRSGALLYVPSGGIGGLDALKTACLAGVDEASIQVAKPPAAWKGIPYVEGEIAYRKGNKTLAVARLREAVALEDALKYDEPPAWTVPTRHSLGAVLIAAQKYADAEAVYREDLKRYPENGWSLRGLAQALEAQGKRQEAAEVKARLAKAWARADVVVDSSCLCIRPGSSGHRP